MKNEEIDKYIRSKVSQIPHKDHDFFNHPTYPWIGGRDQEQEGIWKWSNGTPLNFTKWGNGQPDDYEKSEDCLQFNGERTIDGWNDLQCEKHQMFVCSRSICPDISNNKNDDTSTKIPENFPITAVALFSGVILVVLIIIVSGCLAQRHFKKKEEEEMRGDLNPVYGVYQLGETYERQYSTNEAVDNNFYYDS